MASLSNTFVNVGVNMVLRDQFTQNAGKVTTAFKNLMNDMAASARAVKATYGDAISFFSTGAGIVTESFKSYASVQKDIFLAGKMAGATNDQLKQMQELARDTNLITPLTTKDIASAERFLAMAGNSVEKIQAMIPSIAKLASVFDMEAGGKGGVADLMTNIMAMYQVPSDQVEQVANDLFNATTSANISLRDLAESIKYAGSEMATSGYGIRETAAAIGLLGDMGIQGSSAGTALANTLRYLRKSIAGTKLGGANALAQLGLTRQDLVDTNGELKNLHEIYKTIAKSIEDKNISGFDAANLITEITGVRGSRNLLAAIRQINSGNDTYARVMGNMMKNPGALEQTMKEYMETPQGQIDRFVSTVDALKQSIGEVAAKYLTPVLDVINMLLKGLYNLGNTPIGKWLIGGGVVLSFVTPLVLGVKMMVQLAKSLRYAVTQAHAAIARGTRRDAYAILRNQAATQQFLQAGAGLAPGQRIDLGNGNYLYGKKTGGFGLSYINTSGNRVYTSKDSRMQSWFMSNGRPGNTGDNKLTGRVGGIMGKLGKVGGILGAGASLFGGPVGIALGIGLPLIASALPSVIDAIKGNTSAQQEATELEKQKIKSMSVEEYWAYRDQQLLLALQKLLNRKDKVIINFNGRDIEAELGKMITVDDAELLFNQ